MGVSKLPRCFEGATGLGTCEYIDKRYSCVKDNGCCYEEMPGFNDHKKHYGDSAEFRKLNDDFFDSLTSTASGCSGDEPFEMGRDLMWNGTCTFDWIKTIETCCE